MELLKKFASRKFIAAAASFAFSIAAIIWGADNQWLQIIGAIGMIVAPVVYMFVEAWIDGKSVAAQEYVPTVSTAVYDLVQVYENKYGESGITNFIQDLSILVKSHFDAEVDIEKPEGTE